MKKNLFIIACLSIIIMACGLFSAKLPERNGVYFQPRRGEYQQLMRFTGKPESGDFLKIFDTDEKPDFLFWEPYININLIRLSNIQSRVEYDFSYSTSKNNTIKVSINESLPTGYYCFVQGDSLEAPTMLKHWCFSIGMVDQRSKLEDDLQLQLNTHDMGVFIIDNKNFVELYPDLIDDIFNRKDFFSLPTSYPVVSVRSESINPDQFSLYHLRPAIGISYSIFSEGEITSVNTSCSAHAVGIEPGDTIISVNGFNTTSDDIRHTIAVLAEHLSFTRTTDLQVARKAMIFDVSLIADCYALDKVPFTSGIKSNYYIFYPTSPLQQGGLYCYSDNKSSGYCFSVSP